MDREETNIILSDLCIESSLSAAGTRGLIYASSEVIERIKTKNINKYPNIYEISFEAFKLNKKIDFKDLFLAIASFGEKNIRLIASDKELNINDVVKMIRLPHVQSIKIIITNLERTKLINYISLASKIAVQSKAKMTIKDEENHELAGQINIYQHRLIIIDLEKPHASQPIN